MAEILIDGDGQFPMDVQIPIMGVRFGDDHSLTIRAQGTHRGRPAGLELTIRAGMRRGLIGDEIDQTAFYPDGIIVRSIGDSTRHLTELLSEVYLLPVTDTKPLPDLRLTSFALSGDPMLKETEHLNFKVFHDDSDILGLYFEMYFHVDMPEGYIRLDEKDEEYRTNVLQSFAALPTNSDKPAQGSRF